MTRITPTFFDALARDRRPEPQEARPAPETVSRERLLEIAAGAAPGTILRVIADNRHIGTGVQHEITLACPRIQPIEQFYATGESIRERLDQGDILLMVNYDVDVTTMLPASILPRTIEVRLS